MRTEARRNRLFAWLSLLGLVSLSYMLGAAVMFFQLPSSGFLSRGFIGARGWTEKRDASALYGASRQTSLVGLVDQPGKTFDGFTLYSCFSGTEVFLVNMRGDVVHRWAVPFSRVWHNPPHLEGRQIDDSDVCIFGCHLYRNGDLLVVFHSRERYTTGYGLAKLDRDSNVVWKYAARVHHDVEVGEDGTIYAIAHSPLAERPRGLESVRAPWLVDYLIMLSPEGKELRKPFSILEALRQSSYSPLLSSLEKPRKRGLSEWMTEGRFVDTYRRQDVLHTNSVKVLGRSLAPRFPLFKAGQVLLTIRNLNAIAVLDPDTGCVVWAAQGPWQAQHDARFLDNGHLLIFDNLGSPRSSRVLEYDPRNKSFPWSYPGTDQHPFFTRSGGSGQRLPNGNTLIVDSEERSLLEVTPSKEVVWAASTPAFTNTARRYAAQELSFLKAGQRPRP